MRPSYPPPPPSSLSSVCVGYFGGVDCVDVALVDESWWAGLRIEGEE